MQKNVSPEDRYRYAMIFCAGFYQFYQWWLNDNNFKDIVKPNKVTGQTNELMHNFRKKLFNKHAEIYSTSEVARGMHFYSLDLDLIKDDTELLSFLSKANDRLIKKDSSSS